MDAITAQFIMDTIRGWVEQKKQLPAEEWIKAAEKLNMLESYEHDKLVDLETKVNQMMDIYLGSQEKSNVSAAKIKIKASPQYAEFRKQELFVKRIDETIRLAKHHAKLISYN